MLKRLAVAGSIGVLSAIAFVPTADAATTTYALQVKQKPAKIHGNGSVTVVFWLRCQDGFNAFEFSAGVRQGDTFGGLSAGPAPNVLTCDGERHRVDARVFPTAGAYQRGYADIDVNVQIYDSVNDSDISAEDSERVWLKR